ncbi:MAG: hypothetical protein ACREDM_16025, partial [Methylocella sp.]
MPVIEITRQDPSVSRLRAEAARGRQAGAARSGDRHGAGWAFAAGGRAGRGHGPADAARLGEASQRFQLAQPAGGASA